LYQLILSFSDKLPQIYPHSRCQAVFIRFLISMLYRLIRLFPYVSASQGHLYDLSSCGRILVIAFHGLSG